MNDNVSLGLAHEVEVMLRKVGATRENFWIPISKSEDLARQALNGVSRKPTYSIVVDYSRSLEDMIKAGNYDAVDNDINEDHFPIKSGKSDKKMYSIALFNFNQGIMSDDVLAEMMKKNYRPVLIEELLAFGENYPELLKQFPIAGLGSIWYSFSNLGAYRFPYLTYYSLRLAWQHFYWQTNCRFAAIRE